MRFLSLAECLHLNPVDRLYHSHYVSIIDGQDNATDKDLANIAIAFLTSGGGVVDTDDYTVAAQTSPDKTVQISTGRAYVPTSDGTMVYSTVLDASTNVTISNNTSGEDRTDAIVLYLDLSVSVDDDADNVAKFYDVTGPTDGTGDAPTDAQILTAIGSSNPYITLANISVANGFTSINSSDITDERDFASFKTGTSVDVETYETFTDQTTDAAAPDSGDTRFFTKSGALFSRVNDGNAVQIGASTVKANGDSGSALSIDWSGGNTQSVTLTDDCTLTFTNPTAGEHLTLILSQDDTGSRTCTFPSSVLWANGNAPTLTTTADAVDLIGFLYDGTSYYGFSSLNYTTS